MVPSAAVTLLLRYCPPLSDNRAPGSGSSFSSNTCVTRHELFVQRKGAPLTCLGATVRVRSGGTARRAQLKTSTPVY